MTNTEHDPLTDGEMQDGTEAGEIGEVAISEAGQHDELTDDKQLVEEREGTRDRTDLPADDLG